MTKEYKQYLFVEVPESSYTHVIISGQRLGYVWMDTSHEIELPPGSYSIVGLANELTEEQWEPIVGKPHSYVHKRKRYYNHFDFVAGIFDAKTYTESGYSLLSHLGLGKQVLIIKKEEVMKNRCEVSEEGRPVFYALFYNEFRKAALDCGYALALHGSMASDMDLVAFPWVDNPENIEMLVGKISDCIGKTIWKDHHFKNPTERPHNRITYTLSIFSDWQIDLSIFKPQTNPNDQR